MFNGLATDELLTDFLHTKSTDQNGLCFEHILEYNNYNNIPFSKLKSYLAVDCCGEVCSECLEGLTAKDFALAALDLKPAQPVLRGDRSQMEHESNIQKLDFAVLVPQAQRGDSMAVNSLLLGFTPMVRAFKYNSYYVHYLEQDDTEILALMAVNDAIKSFKQRNFHFLPHT